MANTSDFGDCPASLLDNLQAKLFDSMDRLSGTSIETPQLVVVGDQSSGKSSVLEALVRFHFPVDSKKPTTRFPIKLVLRKADRDAVKVRIEGQGRPVGPAEQWFTNDPFDRIVEQAKAALNAVHSSLSPSSSSPSPSSSSTQSGGHPPTFYQDALIIERQGPNLPRLSLVDLPGLFEVAGKGQTLDDTNMVRTLVSRYIASRMNIILLVISAEVSDYSNVPGLGLLQHHLAQDPSLRDRLVCVLTRPDKAALPDETRELLGTQSPFAGFSARPWHVVRNQDQEARLNLQSLDERDRVEKAFFAGPDWAGVPASQKGIAALRETLKSMIWTHTHDRLAGVISRIKAEIQQDKDQLKAALGARATPMARREYLSNVADSFSFWTREAVQGTNNNKRCKEIHSLGYTSCRTCQGFFLRFGENDFEEQKKRLRANVRALNRSFAVAMREYGRTTVVTDSPHGSLPPRKDEDDGRDLELLGKDEYYVHAKPRPQTRKEYESWVSNNMDRWQAMGPRDQPSDAAAWGTFVYQAQKWEGIAARHVTAVWEAVDEFVSLALAAACQDNDVLKSLRRVIVHPKLDELRLKAHRTLLDLVSCHREANSGFYDTLAEAREVQAHVQSFLRRVEAVKLDPRDDAEGNGPQPEAASPELSNGQSSTSPGSQQANSTHRHGGGAKKAQNATPQRNGGDKKAKDHDRRSQEEFVAVVLGEAISFLAPGIPLVNNPLFRGVVVQAVSRQISQLFEPGSESDSKEPPKRGERRFASTAQESTPFGPGGRAAAIVIEQVEMHYEVNRRRPAQQHCRC